MKRFEGRRVLVTGAGSGIGQATVARILEEGGTVVGADVSEAGLEVDGRFEMVFEPILDRAAAVDFKVLRSIQHQVFGRFTGHVVLDDGSRMEVTDLLGFAEEVRNRW